MIHSNARAPAVFLDRDGTIMRDTDYCSDPKQVKVFAGVPETLRRLKAKGYKLIVITNQSGIGRGFFTPEQYRAVEAEVLRQVGKDLIDATYFCPHRPEEGCKCRKPSPQMITQAAHEHTIDLARSFFIGDKQSDVECGRHAGVKTILVRTGYGKRADAILANFVAEDLDGAANIILEQAL
jgi:D-glycero-D-manno-heptose 1,7-bisphosphate phosphatase